MDYLKTHPKVKNLWSEYVNHEFIKRIGNATLEKAQFCYYLKQDYLFLVRTAPNSLSLPVERDVDNSRFNLPVHILFLDSRLEFSKI